MADKPIVEPNSTFAKAREAMGIEEGDDKDLQVEEEIKEEPPKESKVESKSESKTESEEEEVEEEEEDETEGKDGEENKSIPTHSAKPSRPLKAVFTQMGELRTLVKDLAGKIDNLSPKKAEAVEVIDESLKQLSEEFGADPQALTKLYEAFQKKLMKDLESSGVLKQDLPKEIQDKLSLLDQLQSERKESSEVQLFNTEWNTLLPDLKKSYPFAGEKEYQTAKELMDTLSHDPKTGGVVIDEKNKVLKPYALDYILFKNKSQFDNLLKLASKKKSGETGSREMVEVDENQEIDLDPETMTPEKWKAYQAKKVRENVPENPDILR